MFSGLSNLPNAELIVAAALALAAAILAAAAWRRHQPPPPPVGEPRSIVIVLVHGWRIGRRFWDKFLDLATADPAFGQVEFSRFDYELHWFTRQSLGDLAKTLNAFLVQFRGREVYLVGVGVGALLVRSAYLNELAEPANRRTAITRLILLAPPNHGLGAHRKTLLLVLRSLFGGRALRDAAAGSDFIISLRLRWLRALAQHKLSADVAQIRAANDRYVTEADTWDVSCRPNRAHVVPGTHRQMAQPANVRDIRYVALKDAILGQSSSGATEEQQSATNVRAVLFLVPGIRDWGYQWRREAKTLVDRKYTAVKIVPVQYGWFSTWDFLVRREQRVRQWTDAYTREMALLVEYPEVRRVVLAQSYGTYAVAEAMRRHADIQLDRAYFAGSVLIRQFEWGTLKPGQIRDFRNACGTRDFWVGLMSNGLGKLFSRLGPAGFLGFDSPPPDGDVVVLGGGHGKFAKEPHLEHALDFLLGDTVRRGDLEPAPDWLALRVATLAPVLFPLLVATAFTILGFAAWTGSAWGLPGLDVGEWMSARQTLAGGYFIVGVVMLLKFV